jgi:hypothetical protein
MTNQISLSIAALGLFSSGAFAHGDHSGSVFQVLGHMLSEPDHLAMLSVAAIVVTVLFRVARRKV